MRGDGKLLFSLAFMVLNLPHKLEQFIHLTIFTLLALSHFRSMQLIFGDCAVSNKIASPS